MLGGSAWVASEAPAEPPLGQEVSDVRVLSPATDGDSSGRRQPSVGEAVTADEAVPASAVVDRPVAVVLPSLGVRAEVIELGLDPEGALEVPEDPAEVGWWRGGPAPGEEGAAVLAGHVDSYTGPGAFWRLAELAPGDRVEVVGADGTARVFVVDGVGRWPKDEFPTDAVYRQADGPELRLITCGGVFDERTRSYEDNIVVFASAVGR